MKLNNFFLNRFKRYSVFNLLKKNQMIYEPERNSMINKNMSKFLKSTRHFLRYSFALT